MMFRPRRLPRGGCPARSAHFPGYDQMLAFETLELSESRRNHLDRF